MFNKKGFTMVELLVVLVIIAILAAVATPLFLANTQRARVSEAVATMGLIRQAERDFFINRNTYFDIAVDATDGNIQNAVPTTVGTDGAPTPSDAGVTVDIGVSRYFSNQAFSVAARGTSGTGLADTDGASNLFTSPAAVDFIVTVNGTSSVACSPTITTNCATNAADVVNFDLEMDNSGRIFVCYNTCGTPANWSAY